jgi:predicted phage tail protein
MMRSYRIGGIPAAPTNLKAYASASLIILKWTDNSTDETSFEVERANTESGPFSLVGTADANKKLFIDKGLERHTIYYYRVRAVGDNGASDYSNVISATTR